MDTFAHFVGLIFAAIVGISDCGTKDQFNFGFKPDLKTLKLVQVVWRHGDRMSVKIMPNDPNNNTWPEPMEELTKKGQLQHYNLGQFIKQRYKGFLSEKYDPYEIYVHASFKNRTIVSALANMAGMYPPSNEERFLPSLAWRPIPIHTRPKEQESMLWTDCPCVKASDELKRISKTPEVKKVMAEYKDIIDYVSRMSGFKIKNLFEFHRIQDFLNCQFHHSDTNPWPTWMNETIWDKINEIDNIEYKFRFSTPTMQRLRGGVLVGDLLQRMEQRASGTLDPRLKYYVYSAHDTTLAALLSALGAFNNVHPDYATAVFIELHQDPTTGQHTVQLIYKNETASARTVRLSIAGCGEPCSLKALRKLVNEGQIIPSDWNQECGNEQSQVDWRSLAKNDRSFKKLLQDVERSIKSMSGDDQQLHSGAVIELLKKSFGEWKKEANNDVDKAPTALSSKNAEGEIDG